MYRELRIFLGALFGSPSCPQNAGILSFLELKTATQFISTCTEVEKLQYSVPGASSPYRELRTLLNFFLNVLIRFHSHEPCST